MSDFRYERPATISQATEILAREGKETAILAGGTDLLVALRAGTSRPAVVMDLKGIAALNEVRWNPQGDLILGAAVELERICQEPRIRRVFPALAEGAGEVGSLQVRYRATLGGNLANASPCMDTAPPLLVLGASVVLASSRGERTLPLEDFFVGVKRTALRPDEILASITVPRPPSGLRNAFDKIKRVWGHDLALVNAAAAYNPGSKTLRAAVGSCGVTPILLPLLIQVDSADAVGTGRRLAEAAAMEICPIDDLRASAEYRREMAALLCRRLTGRLLQAGTGRS